MVRRGMRLVATTPPFMVASACPLIGTGGESSRAMIGLDHVN